MKEAPSDPLGWILPGVRPAEDEGARRLVDFLKLLVSEGQPSRTGAVRVDPDEARRDLDRLVSADAARAVEDLLHHHLAPLVGGDSFAWWGSVEGSSQEAWTRLESFRADMVGLPDLPAPGETRLSVARRILSGEWRMDGEAPLPGWRPGRWDLWRARLAGIEGGARAGEAAHRELLGRDGGVDSGVDGGSDLDPLDRIAAVSGVAECMLDRGAVRAACTWLDEGLALVSCSERLARLFAWTHLLLGEVEPARELAGTLGPWGGPLPRPLLELRERVPEWLGLLSGQEARAVIEREAVESRASPSSDEARIRSRGELGAVALGVFVLRPSRAVESIELDVAPALREGSARWLRSRDGAPSVSGEPEHRLIAGARPVVVHRTSAEPLRGVLAPTSARSLALAPVLDPDGEVAGWLHIECEHHLLPSCARLERLARAWRGEVLARAAPALVERRSGRHAAGATAGVARERSGVEVVDPPFARMQASAGQAEARREAVSELVGELGMKTLRRRWWAFELLGGEPRLLHEGGGALSDWETSPGGAQGLLRALRTSGPIAFEEPDPRLAIHSESCSGAVLPLSIRGEPIGLFAVESLRRKEFRGADLARLASLVAGASRAFRVAELRDWHRERFGHDIWLDPSPGGFGPRVDELVAAGRSRSPVALSGPGGAGKGILARWLHYESGERDARMTVFPCSAFPGEAGAERLGGESWSRGERRGASGLLGETGGGSLLLDDVDHLGPRVQSLLDAWLAESATRPGAPRLVMTTRHSLAQASSQGRLCEKLAARLDRFQVHAPPLARRRSEIPPLVRLLLRRFSAEEGLRQPEVSDPAMAILWRQDWPGNLRELENVVYKIALLYPGREIGPGELEALARRFHLSFARRLSSRKPDPVEIRAALALTRKQSGASNKTRAALYLGWDPDTLVLRMREASIGDGADRPRADDSA